MGISQGIVIESRKLDGLEPILRGWIRGINEYCRVIEDDAPYWYNERANIGALAVGAIKASHVVLEEYTVDRWHNDKRAQYGRADIFISAKEDGGFDVTLESKMAFVRPKTELATIESRIGEACDDVLKLRDADLKVGAVFIAPSFAEQPADKEIRQFLDRMKGLKTHAMAWCFPTCSRGLHNDKQRYYPGVILAIRIARRKRKFRH